MSLTMFWRTSLVVTVVAVTLIAGGLTNRPAASSELPHKLAVALQDVNYDDLGTTTANRIGDRILLRTTGLHGLIIIVCLDNQACLDLGLDGAQVEIQQNLGIVVGADVHNPLLRSIVGGRTSGTISITRASGETVVRSFDGRVTGDGECAADVCSAAMAIRAASPRGGTLSLDLTGTLLVGGDGPDWASMTGEGIIGILIAL